MPQYLIGINQLSMKAVLSFFATLSLDKKILLTLTPILTVITNSQQALIGLLILIIIDLITGAYKSLKKKKIQANPLKLRFWKSITSQGFRVTWKKSYEYGIGILILAIMEALFFPGIKFHIFQLSWSFAQIGIALACLIEVYSIFENIEEVTGNNPLKKITKILTNIRKIFKN